MINELIFVGVSFFHPIVLQDSVGTETVNGKIFVIHQVGEKETLYGISRRYGTTVETILQYNPTADGGLEIGQILKVPYVPKRPVRPEGTLHTVAAKETMFSISQAYHVTIDEIKQWNNLTDNSLSIGQEIMIKKPATSMGNAQTPSPTKNNGLHLVAAKETMFSITRQHGITMEQLKAWNKLEGNEISIGQELIVAAPKNEVVRPTTNASGMTSVPVIAEIKKDQTPVQTTQPKVEPREQPIRISESVKNSDEIMQTGLAELISGTEGNRKYLALHRTAPVGTILKVKNEMNNREVFVRVMGKLPETALTDKLVIKISKSAYDRLGAIDSRFRVEVTYYK